MVVQMHQPLRTTTGTGSVVGMSVFLRYLLAAPIKVQSVGTLTLEETVNIVSLVKAYHA